VITVSSGCDHDTHIPDISSHSLHTFILYFLIFKKERIQMKRLITLLLLAIGLATSASAHHMAQSDTAGWNIDEDSPHLLMTF